MIQKIYKVFNVSASHQLSLPYDSKCNQQHGHNYKIEVSIGGVLNSQFMIMDFSIISKIVKRFDHVNLNDIFIFDRYDGDEIQATAEMLAIRIARDIVSKNEENTIKGIQVRVWETDSCYAEVYIQENEFKVLKDIYQVEVTKAQIPEFHEGGVISEKDMVNFKDELAAKKGDHIIESK